MRPYFSFQWHLTDHCDQRCKHCYIFSRETDEDLSSMDWGTVQDTLANCLDFCQVYHRRPYFYLTGGDPLLHPKFWRLLTLLREEAIPFTILGNPYHLTKLVCNRLKALGCERYQLSLDGLRETHDWFRRPGSFDCTLEKLPLLKEAGIRTVIMTTVSGKNIAEIPALVDLAAEREVDVYAFARYCPGGGETDNGLTPQGYRALLAACDEKFRAYEAAGCATYFNKKDHLWTLYDYETGAFQPPPDARPGMIYGGCNCGNGHLTILPDGEVMACRRVPESRVGNVRQDRLADLWAGEMEAYRDYQTFEKCGGCELLPWCRGCPAVAKSVRGSYYAPDPQCWKEELPRA